MEISNGLFARGDQINKQANGVTSEVARLAIVLIWTSTGKSDSDSELSREAGVF